MKKPERPLSPLRALIVDDESLARDCIRLALEPHEDVDIVAECASGEEAVEAIREHRPDLVFLDVQMPGLDGFGVVERIGVERMPAVVFVTAYDAHAIRAFDVHAMDYVLKPFDDERLARAIERARTHVTLERQGELSARIRALLAEMGRAPQANGQHGSSAAAHVSRIAVRASDRLYFVKVAEIDYFAGAGNYVELHVGDRSFRIRTTISGLVDQLDPKHFVRIHRSTIVNIDRIREVQPWLGGDHIAILHTGQKLRVSRTFADELLRPMR